MTPFKAGCNCRGRPCPLGGKCLTDRVVYRATVEDEDRATSTYAGLTANSFKQRYCGHKQSFNQKIGESSTTLSTHIWNLKDRNKDYNITWEVVDRARPFNPTTRKCRLCQREKFYIKMSPKGATVNSTIGAVSHL